MLAFDVSAAAAADVTTDLLILPFFQGPVPSVQVREVQDALGTDLMALLGDNGIVGHVGDAFVVPTLGRLPARQVLLLGLGDQAEAGPGALRSAAMKAAAYVRRFAVVCSLPRLDHEVEVLAQAFVEGLMIGTYRFDRYKSGQKDASERQSRPSLRILVGSGDHARIEAAAHRGHVYAEAVSWARDLVNMAPAELTPDLLAEQAATIAADLGLDCHVWATADLEQGGFGGILGMGRGSSNAPRLIELAYRGAGQAAPIALVGKGVTFDAGGLNVKVARDMRWMKADMAGAAAVLAAMRAVARLRLAVNVVAAIPSIENLPGHSAIRPGDVIRHFGGRTTEITNTDAEGRVILADALAYMAEKRPRAIIDAATLTDALLGEEVWAVLGTGRQVIADLLAAGAEAGEPGWELPLRSAYRRHMESAVADLRNWDAATTVTDTINAAVFLREFVGDVPWAHIDIVGTAYMVEPTELWPAGATGSPTRTFIRYLEGQAAAL